MLEIRVQSLGAEDPLEKEIASHSSIVAWKIPWTRNLVDYIVHGVTKELSMTEQLNNNNDVILNGIGRHPLSQMQSFVLLTDAFP